MKLNKKNILRRITIGSGVIAGKVINKTSTQINKFNQGVKHGYGAQRGLHCKKCKKNYKLSNENINLLKKYKITSLAELESDANNLGAFFNKYFKYEKKELYFEIWNWLRLEKFNICADCMKKYKKNLEFEREQEVFKINKNIALKVLLQELLTLSAVELHRKYGNTGKELVTQVKIEYEKQKRGVSTLIGPVDGLLAATENNRMKKDNVNSIKQFIEKSIIKKIKENAKNKHQ